ncbi:MAG: VWA domain-containing protein, partial [Clostridiales bacterium]|nr:VWA domain-containing protein [Clostridiales bacterium]
RTAVDIILVLDVSGSMGSATPGEGESKIKVLKDAVEMFIRSWEPFAIPNDRLGIVYFESEITLFPDLAPNLLPLQGNVDTIIDAVRSKSAAGWTAMGGGILTGKNSYEECNPNEKVIILFTDGMQNYSPMVVEERAGYEIRTLPIDPNGAPPVLGESGVPGEPGVSLADFGVVIHTIGVGVPGEPHQSLLENIANETGGLSYFTDSPNDQLREFYEMSLVAALSTNSVERVNHFVGDYRPEMGEVAKGFNINRSADKAAFILSWRGDNSPGAMTFSLINPDGIEIDLTNIENQGDFFKIASFSLPFTQNGEEINHVGNWHMRINGNIQTIYDASLLVDEPELKCNFTIVNEDYGTGAEIPLAIQVKQGSKVLKNMDNVQVRITRPKQSLRALLAKYFVSQEDLENDFGLDPDNFPTLLEKKQHFLLKNNEKFNDKLQEQVVEIKNLNDEGKDGDKTANDGIYSANYTQTKRPGLYEFEFNITGKTQEDEMFARNEIFSKDVRVKIPDTKKSEIAAIQEEGQKNSYQITITPIDRYDNFLGPGYSDKIQIASSAGTLGALKDCLDGAYQTTLNLSDSDDPKSTRLTFEVLNKKIGSDELPKFLIPRERWGISLDIPTPTGDIKNYFDQDINTTLNVEYRHSFRFSSALLAGYHRFSNNKSLDSFKSVSGNVIYYVTTTRLVPFLKGGGGVYIPNKSRTSFGLNGGVGLSFRLTSTLYMETILSRYKIYTENKNTDFSASQ